MEGAARRSLAHEDPSTMSATSTNGGGSSNDIVSGETAAAAAHRRRRRLGLGTYVTILVAGGSTLWMSTRVTMLRGSVLTAAGNIETRMQGPNNDRAGVSGGGHDEDEDADGGSNDDILSGNASAAAASAADGGLVFAARPRVWTPPSWPSFPCFDPGPMLKFHGGRREAAGGNGNSNSTARLPPLRPMVANSFHKGDVRPTRGLLFVKPMKVGGSTATGVNLRISKNMAERYHRNQQQQQLQQQQEQTEPTEPTEDETAAGATTTTSPAAGRRPFPMCENSYDHTRGTLFHGRDPSRSFLWSLLREPSGRAVSYFYHLLVARKGVAPDLPSFRDALPHLKDYYLRVHFVAGPGNSSNSNSSSSDPNEWLVQDIIDRYNFIGITERFDESMVVMKLLLDRTAVTSDGHDSGSGSGGGRVVVPLGDFLYLSSKVHGGYDHLCTYIPPTNLTSDMRAYMESEDFEGAVRYDRALYVAANRSLDRTIDELLGRAEVEAMLAQYRAALRVVHDRCAPLVRFGCDLTTDPSNPRRRPDNETNCLFLDSACAYQCIDQVAEELGLNEV